MKHTKLFNRRSFLRAAGSAFMLSALGPLATGCGGSGGGSFTRIRSEVEVREPGGAFLYSDYQALLSAVQDLVDTIYRSEPFFSFGDRVTIKPNLISSDDWEGLSAALTYTTHASVVRALGEALLDQGAGSLVIAEGTTSALGTPAVFQALGYDEVAEYLGASLIDLNHPDPWPDLAEKDVPGGLVYDSIQYNRVLDETDCLVSAAKLKEHTSAGVTLSLKNLVGILPLSVYRSPFGISRGEYVHGAGNQLISGNIVDLARSFPIRFALIDGLAVSLGGEAPHVGAPDPWEPGLMLASTDPVALDAAATVFLGYDPLAEYPKPPFTSCPNHILLASESGLGLVDPADIEIRQ